MRFALLLACLPVVMGVAQAPSRPDLAGHFKGLNGTFVLLNGATGEYIRYNPKRAEGRLRLTDRTSKLTKEIMVAQETPSWRLSAKTGACQPSGEETSNWYVAERIRSVFP